MPACKRFALTVLMVLTGSAPLAVQDLVAQDKKAVTIKKVSPDQLDFMVGTEVVTSYRFGTNYAKPIFWPVLAPNGASLTRSWPMVKDIPGESTRSHSSEIGLVLPRRCHSRGSCAYKEDQRRRRRRFLVRSQGAWQHRLRQSR